MRKTALNLVMHRSRTFLSDRSERFSASQVIFSHWARTVSGSGPEVRYTWGSRGDVRGLLGDRHVSGSGSELVRMVDCEHAAASLASSPRVTPTGTRRASHRVPGTDSGSLFASIDLALHPVPGTDSGTLEPIRAPCLLASPGVAPGAWHRFG